MADIDRFELMEDIKLYTIGLDNPLTTNQINRLVQKVIDAVGNTTDDYAEVLCKSLRSIADVNSATTTRSGQLKSVEIENTIKEEYQTDNFHAWERYIDGLDRICAGFGYEDESLATVGIFINPGDDITKQTDEIRESIIDNVDCIVDADDDLNL